MGGRVQPVELDLSATALVVVDMQNDFLHLDGWFAKKGEYTVTSGKAMRHCEPKLWRSARSSCQYDSRYVFL